MTGIIIISATIGALVGAMAMLLAGNRTKMRLLRDNEQLKANLQNANRQNTELQSAHKTELKRLEETQQRQLEQQMALIKEQMNSASELILQHRQQQLEQTNIRQMGLIVEPLKMELKRMQEVVDKASLEHSSSMVRLDSAIKTNLMQAKEVGDKADRLAQALTGESKTQGDFGELKLKQMLDEMGFEEGLQYEQQTTMRDRSGHTVIDQGGHRLQPDVILHFPENRDIIIDSKVSLTAFKDYCDSTTDEQRKEMLNRHVASVRRHIDELSHKDYSRHLNGGKVDFVVMYVFSDKALQLAAAAEPHLYRDAYDKRVIICGSNNLYGLLRVLESSWRQMKQVENQQHFVEAANSIIERVLPTVGAACHSTSSHISTDLPLSYPLGIAFLWLLHLPSYHRKQILWAAACLSLYNTGLRAQSGIGLIWAYRPTLQGNLVLGVSLESLCQTQHL